MKWYNLKQNKCPQCDIDLVGGSKKTIINGEPAIKHSCGFTIRERRFSEIVNGQITKEIEAKLNREVNSDNQSYT